MYVAPCCVSSYPIRTWSSQHEVVFTPEDHLFLISLILLSAYPPLQHKLNLVSVVLDAIPVLLSSRWKPFALYQLDAHVMVKSTI
jgi:hypothetical protein